MLPFLVKSHNNENTPEATTILSQLKSQSLPRIAPDDPLIGYLVEHPEVVDLQDVPIESAAKETLKEQGVKTIVPLVAQGELIGMINLGQRLSEQEYSLSDRRLLNRLSSQAAIALKVAEMAEVQQSRARMLERMDHELQVAQIIQKTLLPKLIPRIDGWKIGSFWKPAQAIGGDFYDFLNFPDGRLGVIVGDVTDKGIPAALVMAETRSLLRAVALRYVSPGPVLARVNDMLGPDIPDRMFITCLYAVVDPVHGHVRFANAGHNIPVICNSRDVREVMVRGMPLGIFPGMEYEEVELDLTPGSTLLMYSDGISEAHNTKGEIYGTTRLKDTLRNIQNPDNTIQIILEDLEKFTGNNLQQEDDITIVTSTFHEVRIPVDLPKTLVEDLYPDEPAHVLTEFSLPSLSGNDRVAMEKVTNVLEPYSLEKKTLERIRTAVAETALNAIEHGNRYQPELPITIRVLTSRKALSVRITDCGESGLIPEMISPDLSAKLEGVQSSRGWGLFLIKSMSDEMQIYPGENGNTVELLYRLDETGINPKS